MRHSFIETFAKGRSASCAIAIIGMAFFWKYFRQRSVDVILQPHEATLGSPFNPYLVAFYLLTALVALAFVRKGLAARFVKRPALVVLCGALASLCLLSPLLMGGTGAAPGALSIFFMALGLGIYAVSFVVSMGTWTSLLSNPAYFQDRTPLFVISVSLLLNIILFSFDVMLPAVATFLNIVAPAISAGTFYLLAGMGAGPRRAADKDGDAVAAGGVACEQRESSGGLAIDRPLFIVLACMLIFSVVMKDLVGHTMVGILYGEAPLVRNIITILELTLVVSVCLFTPSLVSFSRYGWLVIAGLFLAELLLVALPGPNAARIAQATLFTVPVCFEMYLLQLVVMHQHEGLSDNTRLAYLAILIPEMLAHVFGYAVMSFLEDTAAAEYMPALSFGVGTGVVACIFFIVSSYAFKKPAVNAGDAAAAGQHQPRTGLAPEADKGAGASRVDALAQRAGLTQRERDILGYLYRGYSNKRIAEMCCISVNTVQTHVQNCYHKLDIHTRQDLIDLIDGTEG